MLVYQCDSCKSNGGINPNLQTFITLINSKIDKLGDATKIIENNNQEMKAMKNNIAEIKKEARYEMLEIIRKSKNVIIHNLDNGNDKDKDENLISELFK